MSQPQYQGPAFDAGATPTPGAYLDPTSVAPEVDCAAAVDAAVGRRSRLEGAAGFGNNSEPGTYTATGGVSTAGVNEDS